MLTTAMGVSAQIMPRPDAFPPEQETLESKATSMASTVEEMSGWDRYPTYETYLEMMRRWAEDYPELCHVDTLGTSVRGRLILSMYINAQEDTGGVAERPEFFYSSTIHGDEVTGYVMMLRLIDTLLSSYGTSPELTDLMDRTRISINPLANPDGTYWGGNETVGMARRYNANNIDLNRNFPNPFAVALPSRGGAKAGVPVENQVMMDYFEAHNFRLSANLHGGAEVMNYPWDSFTSAERPHPAADWWEAVCKRFVDTARAVGTGHFNSVCLDGYIAGGDWYVITGGRQDYVNAVYNCLEVTMEISVKKLLSSERLPEYWHFLAQPFINYIKEIHTLPAITGIGRCPAQGMVLLKAFPNPTTGLVNVGGLAADETLQLYDMSGRMLEEWKADGRQQTVIDLKKYPQGIYLLRAGVRQVKLVVER